MNPKRTWPPAEWIFVEPDEDAIRKLIKPPEISAEIRAGGADYAKRKANLFAQDNGKPLPFPDIEAELQKYMTYITGKDGIK